MKGLNTSPMPVPDINRSLPPRLQTHLKKIFYQHSIRVAGVGLRGQWNIYGSLVGRNDTHDNHDMKVWSNPIFRLQYEALRAIVPTDTIRRYEPCFREFIFFNQIGDVTPHQEGLPPFGGEFEVEKTNDIYGDYVTIKVYKQLSGQDWAAIQKVTNKMTLNLGEKSGRNIDNLDLLVNLSNLCRELPAATYSDLAGQLHHRFPDLATKKSGYTEDDIRKMVKIIKRLRF